MVILTNPLQQQKISTQKYHTKVDTQHHVVCRLSEAVVQKGWKARPIEHDLELRYQQSRSFAQQSQSIDQSWIDFNRNSWKPEVVA
jgi:hypothetical protein